MKKLMLFVCLVCTFAFCTAANAGNYNNSLDHKLEVRHLNAVTQNFTDKITQALDSAQLYLSFTLRVQNNEMGENDLRAKNAVKQGNYTAALKYMGYDKAVTQDPKQVALVYASAHLLKNLPEDFISLTAGRLPDFNNDLFPPAETVAKSLKVDLPSLREHANASHPLP